MVSERFVTPMMQAAMPTTIPLSTISTSTAHLLLLPTELLSTILTLLDDRSLLRTSACNKALKILSSDEDAWAARLALLCKGKLPKHATKRWWICELRSSAGAERRALPSPCTDTPTCKTLRECSFKESFKHAVLDAARKLVREDELMDHAWSMVPPPEMRGAPGNHPSPSHVALFRPDGSYVDSAGPDGGINERGWELLNPPKGAAYPPQAVNLARDGPAFVMRTENWGWELATTRGATLTMGGSLRERIIGCVLINLEGSLRNLNGAFATVEAYCEARHAYRVILSDNDSAIVGGGDGASPSSSAVQALAIGLDLLRLGSGHDEAPRPVQEAQPTGAPATPGITNVVVQAAAEAASEAEEEALWLPPENVVLPRGARVQLRGDIDGCPHYTDGKEGRVVESPIPPMWAVPLHLRNASALREAVGRGIVTVRLSMSDEIRVSPGQYLASM